jgi:ferredoxin
MYTTVNRMHVDIDEMICGGCGLCAEACPRVFAMKDNSGVAYVRIEEVPADLEDTCRTIAEECPVRAIFIEEGEPTT